VLADQYYLITHEDRDGRSRLHPRATGLGLAAALIGELLLLDRVSLVDGELRVVNRETPGDALTHDVLELLITQAHHRDVHTWLAYLAQDAAAKVGERLFRAGAVGSVVRRRLMGSQTHYLPMNAEQRNAAAWAPVRLANVLVRHGRMDLTDRTLAGLVHATGLTKHLLWDFPTHRPGMAHLYAMVESLPPPMRELVEQTEAAVGSALVVGRR
jgi:hypothetical protein